MHCRHHCIIEKLLHLILEGRLITSILFKVPREDLALVSVKTSPFLGLQILQQGGIFIVPRDLCFEECNIYTYQIHFGVLYEEYFCFIGILNNL